MRVALVAGTVPPYRLPVWEELQRRLGTLDVFVCEEREANRVWQLEDGWRQRGPRYWMLDGYNWYVQRRDWGFHFNPGLVKALRASSPDALIVLGYDTPSYVMAMRYARRAQVPLTLWWGSHASSSRSKRGVIAAIRRHVARWADSYVTYGSLATEYLVQMGVDRRRIVTGTNTVDVDRLHSLVRQHRTPERDDQPGRVRFLYVGQLIERKGVKELLRAFCSIDPKKAMLRIVGHGPLENELRQIVSAQSMTHVEMAGQAVTMEELAAHYASADVLVMPSLIEVWGLVVNEALASGLYVLSSKYAGVTPDLVTRAPIAVGEAIDPRDPQSLARQLATTVDRVRGGLVDREAISWWGLQHTPKAYADAVYRAVALACGRHDLTMRHSEMGSGLE